MKTKITFRALATIAAGLMLVSLLTFSGRTTRADTPVTLYQPTEVYTYIDYGDGYVFDLLYSMTYGPCGNRLNQQNYSKSGDDWIPGTLYTWTWDDYCNLLQKLTVSSSGKHSYEKYTYDCNANILTYISGGGYLPNLTDQQRKSYTYDGAGNLLTELREDWSSGNWIFNYRYTRTYDSDGNKLTELYESKLPSNNILRIMTYDDAGNMLKQIEKKWNGTSWYDYNMTAWTYDQNGNIIMKEQMLSSGSSGSRETYSYDEQSNWLTKLTENFSDGMWINSTLITRTFDGSGNILSQLAKIWDEVGNIWEDNLFYTWTYGEDGNIVRILKGVESWGYYNKFEYEYGPGEITCTVSQLVYGEWVSMYDLINFYVMIDGEQHFIYSGVGNVVKVKYNATPEQLEAEITPYQTVYYGYPPSECVTVSVTPINGTPPYTYQWSNGETSASIEVCPTESTEYKVVITDAIGCQVQACTRVCVIDVRCGAKLNKVLLCHYPPEAHGNPQTLCVAQAAVPAHLAHGDQLGACGIERTCTDELKSAPADVVVLELEEDAFIKAYPNPVNQSAMVSYMVNQPDKMTIRLVNSMGQPVMTLFEGYASAGEIQDMEVDMGRLQPGVYLLILQQADGSRITEKILKE